MKFTNRALLFPALLLLPFFAGGCAQNESALRENETLRNAARAVLFGKTYDRMAIARRNNDQAALLAAAQELETIDPLAAAEQLVLAGVQLDGRAMLLQDTAQKQKLEAQAAEKYREALRIAPNFPSRNPNLLNALGYFLADRGDSESDFKTAEKLTRAAIKIMDAAIAEIEDAPMTGTLLAAHRFNRAQGPRDSLAWALFKQRRFKEAREMQVAGQISADLYFHLAEIERALNNTEAAKTNYRKALQAEPNHAPTLEALSSLAPSTPVPNVPAPSTPPPSTPALPDEEGDDLESDPL